MGNEEDQKNHRSYGVVGERSAMLKSLLARIIAGETVTVIADYQIKTNIQEETAIGMHTVTTKFLLIKEIL
jgi:hypothetical protein